MSPGAGSAALWPGTFGLHPPALPPRPLAGLAAVNANDHEHERPDARLRVRPFPANTDPAGTTASADFSTASSSLSAVAVPHHPANRTSDGHLGHPWRPPRIRPATFLAHPPHLRDGPLMTSGFAITGRLARTAPPHTRSPPDHRARAMCSSGRDFASGFLPTPPHDDAVALGLWLVPSPPQGTRTPELLVMPGAPGRPDTLLCRAPLRTRTCPFPSIRLKQAVKVRWREAVRSARLGSASSAGPFTATVSWRLTCPLVRASSSSSPTGLT